MINWKVRFKQPWFWLTAIPLLFLLLDQLCSLVDAMAYAITVREFAESQALDLMLRMVTTLFSLLALIGFPVDLTTEGYGDGVIGMSYTEPAINAAQYGLDAYENDMLHLSKDLANSDASYEAVEKAATEEG